MSDNFKNAPPKDYDSTKIIRSYSITSDILSYLICPRRYGFFTARKFSPSSNLQFFYGTIIHQILDKAHLHYKGLIGEKKAGTIPTDNEIEGYFDKIKKALNLHGIRSKSDQSETLALKYVKIFNKKWGPKLYPLIKDSEHSLRMNRKIKAKESKGESIDYLLKGLVDVLINSDTRSENPGDVQIWDYKGKRKPEKTSPFYQKYVFQMRVYAELYRYRHGVLPDKAVLVFINELRNPNATYEDLTIEVSLEADEISNAMEYFENVVIKIEKENSKPFQQAWSAPEINERPDENTCNICDLRWSCPTVKGKYSIKAP